MGALDRSNLFRFPLKEIPLPKTQLLVPLEALQVLHAVGGGM